MTPEAHRLLQRAAVEAAASMPEADDVSISAKTARLLAEYAAQLEQKLGFQSEESAPREH